MEFACRLPERLLKTCSAARANTNLSGPISTQRCWNRGVSGESAPHSATKAASTIAAIAVDDATVENGAVELFPGLHHELIPDTPESPRDVDPSAIDMNTGVFAQMKAGDVLFFHACAPHQSQPNRTDRWRRTFFCTYHTAAKGNRYGEYYDSRDAALRPAVTNLDS